MELKHKKQLWVVIITLIVSILACNFGSAEPTIEVEIRSPGDDAEVIVGEEVEVVSSVNASEGVARVELWVDGEIIQTDEAPAENPEEFQVTQLWTPREEGAISISTVAYDVDGNISSPAIMNLQVVEASPVEETLPSATPEPTDESPDTPTPEPEDEEECTYEASFVSDVTIPDGTELDPGASFVKTWRVENSGTCDWEEGFQLLFASGDQLGGPAGVDLPSLAVGEGLDISVDLTAPSSPGTYQGDWRFRSLEGSLFGTNLIVEIVVPEPATDTPEPSDTPEPTETPTPTPTSFVVVTVKPITLVPILPYTDLVYEQVSIASGDTGSATVSCPGGSVVVSGGYAASPEMLVYSHAKSGNGWRAYAKNNAGSSILLNVYATCLYNAPAASTTQVFQQVTASGGGIGHPEVECPSGSVVTGGGWATNSNGTLRVYNSSKKGNGWQVYAENLSGSGQAMNAYAVCLSGLSAEAEQIMESTDITGGSTGYAVPTCGSGKIVTGGGFAAQEELVIYNTSPYLNVGEQWRTYAKNIGSGNRTMYGYAVCLSFP